MKPQRNPIPHWHSLDTTQSHVNIKEPSFFTSKKIQKVISLIRRSLSQSNLPSSPSFTASPLSKQSQITPTHPSRNKLHTQLHFQISSTFTNNSTNYSINNPSKSSSLPVISSPQQKNSISPNSKSSRRYNEMLYHKIFPKLFIEKTEEIDNKLNILYSENLLHFNKQFNQLKLKQIKGNKINFHGMQFNSKQILNRVDNIKKKLHFFRGVCDYVYPQVVVMKIKEKQKLMKRNQQRVRMNVEQKKKKIVKSLSTGNLNLKDVYNVKVYSNNYMENKEIAWMNMKRRGKKG